MEPYFRILGLQPGASVDDIRRAYRRLAKQFHPDVNPEGGTRERFLEIVEAYEVLMGERKPKARQSTVDHDAIRRRAKEEALRKARMRYAEFVKQQEKEQNEAYGQALLWVIIGAAAILTFLALQGPFNAWRISANPYQTTCRITFSGYREATVQYAVDGVTFNERVTLRRSYIETLSGNGMPLRPNHTFAVRCNREDPTLFEVLWEYPGTETMEAYLRAAAKRIPEAFPETSMDEDQAACLAQAILQSHGIDGLATLFFFDEPALENYQHNAWVFASEFGQVQPEEAFPQCF